MPYMDPKKQRLAKAESAKRSRARARQERTAAAFGAEPARASAEPVEPLAALGPLLPESIRLRDMEDVVALLEIAARLIAGDRAATPLEKGRAFATVASASLRAVDAASYAPRIAALEAIVSPRRLRSIS